MAFLGFLIRKRQLYQKVIGFLILGREVGSNSIGFLIPERELGSKSIGSLPAGKKVSSSRQRTARWRVGCCSRRGRTLRAPSVRLSGGGRVK